jgi:CHAD domain-containing protein
MATLRRANAEALLRRLDAAEEQPRRKRLHELRLKVKSIRYQEEWALGQPYERPDLISQLKQAQAVLGDYEERAQFRKLAAKLRLKSFERIEKGWRRARERAQAVPVDLRSVAESMTGGRLRLVRPAVVAS